MTAGDQQIIPGISLSTSGHATVDPSLFDVLFDYAIQLEEATNLPVDVEHALAAIVLAARKGELDPNTKLTIGNSAIHLLLIPHVRTVFAVFGGEVGQED
jgi:hypothetical protein